MSSPAHPVSAARLADLGLDYLIGYKIARLLVPPGYPEHPRLLARSLADVRDLPSLVAVLRDFEAAMAVLASGADLAAYRQAISHLPPPGGADAAAERAVLGCRRLLGDRLVRALGDAPFDPREPVERQLAPAADGLLSALALIEHGLRIARDEDTSILLPAPLLPRPELPPLGVGPIEVCEVGDLQDHASVEGRANVRRELEAVADRFHWRWLHGPVGGRRASSFAAGLAEAIAERAPAHFWEGIRRLYRWQTLVEVGVIADVVAGLPVDPDAVLRRATEADIVEKIGLDHAMATTCAVPPIRPAFVVGRRLFLGGDQAGPLRAEVERRLAGAPAARPGDAER